MPQGTSPETAETKTARVVPNLRFLIVIGVSGSGKSTIGAMLARRLGWDFEDADWFHPPANIEKMHHGNPLTDDDRLPWLKAIARWIGEARSRGGHAVIACSALKRRYRDILLDGQSDVGIIYLKGDEELIARRLAARHEHFMPASLLKSQIQAFEEPSPDENPIVISIQPPPKTIVNQIVQALNHGH